VNELMLVPEVEARAALRGHPLRFSVLVPYGAWIGCGSLRVLRLKIHDDESADLTVGYESYERLGDPPARDPRKAMAR
jgi:hypothetical protein